MKAFANLPWKIVFDLDANSDEDGFLTQFKPGETTCGSIVQLPPSQLDKLCESHIDMTRVQWVFANGQNKGEEKDSPKNELEDWCMSSEPAIQDFIQSCCKKLDKMKPTFCIVLGLRDGISTEIAKMVVRDLHARFERNESVLRFCSFDKKLQLQKYKDAQFSRLPLEFISLGMHAMLGRSDEDFLLPSHGSFESIPRMKYHNINRRLEVLYKGCENEGRATELADFEERLYENDQLKSFVGGNPISFTSLHCSHDARRTLSKEIHRCIDTMPRHSASKIVTIKHAPGSGGSTIARRVLWDLHEKYPCAIVRMDQVKAFSGTEPEVDQFIEDVAERIGEIENACDEWPIILLDGDSRMVRIVSDRLKRKLDPGSKRAILLRCLYLEAATQDDDESSNNFHVNSVLADDKEELEEFQAKYSDYHKRFQSQRGPDCKFNTATRVFHFPMMAMLGKSDELKKTVTECLEIIKKDNPWEYEVAVLVAYLQKYSTLETPASLITQYFKRDFHTYQEMAQHFSQNLLNLMVSKQAPNKKKWIGLRYKWREDCEATEDERFSDMYPRADRVSGWYTFQHIAVADQVLLHCKRDLKQLTKEFVKTPVLENYNKKSVITSLIDNLFLYNKDSEEDRFTFLIQNLNDEGESFEEAAKRTKDAIFYSHVARYFAYKKNPNFEHAKHLIEEGLAGDVQAATKERRVRETEGHILLRELKLRQDVLIKTLADLEYYADIAFQKFRKARDRPPTSFPNPLLGEVNCWQFCFEWLITDKGSPEKAKRFIINAEEGSFFCGSISECFDLLNQVDQIVQSSQNLVNPIRTTRLANSSRLSLLKTFHFIMKTNAVTSGTLNDFCKDLCSPRNIKHASEKELIRLRASLMINQAQRKLHLLHDTDCVKLFEMLEQLVCQHEMFEYAQYLMNVAALQRTGPFNLDRALEVVSKWQNRRPYDFQAYFYEYMFRFLKVRGGELSLHRSRYEEALTECAKLCHGSPQKFMHQFYIKNTDEKCSSIRQLMTSLELGTRLDRVNSGQKTDDNRGPDFHNEDCRRLMLECEGRIKLQGQCGRNKQRPVILLEQGGLPIDVHPKDVGNPYSDYTPNSLVRFIVCFTLNGPKAKGVVFCSK